ncbi:hypothetical protein ACOAOT_22290 [Lacrimispora sp. AGF001]|uniref:hypothetical protein n=1 Tax=Lacrimispora sp. AGF001 TaxID=3401631 RepID=UPI003B42D44B
MEATRSSSDLQNKYLEISALTRESQEPVFTTVNGREDTVLMSHVQYEKIKLNWNCGKYWRKLRLMWITRALLP